MRRRRTFGAMTLSILGVSGVLSAQPTNRWDSVGPPPVMSFTASNSVQSVAVDPSDSATLYAGTGRALYKSIDRGGTWRQVLEDRIGSPINPFYRPITLLSIDPADPATLFAATGGGALFGSRDAGDHWFPALVAQGVASVFVSSGGSGVFACVTPGLAGLATFRSLDSGATWTELAPLAGKSVQAFADDTAIPGRVWAAVSLDPAGASVYVSENGGTTWTSRSAGLTSTRLTALAIDPDAPETLYAGTADAGVFKTVDGGRSWAPVNLGLPGAEIVTLAAGPGNAVYAGTRLEGLVRSDDGGGHWTPAGLADSQLNEVVLDPSAPDTLYAAAFGLLRITWGPAESCATSAEVFCVQGARFLVRSSWRTRHESGVGQAVGMTSDTGYFWFFQPDNVEVTVKVLDGRPVDGNFWVFYGALSNVEYVITVIDTATGSVQSYFNFQGVQASVADTSAFPGDSAAPALGATAARLVRPALADACEPGPYALCLNEGRFRVDVISTRTPLGPSVLAAAVPLTGDTGYFWFFDPDNVELVVKVLDGRAVNGHFWVFYGALSNVEYAITVTDTQTGDQRTYHNDRGNLASVADTSAF